ncbi:MAG: YigZ family protein [Bacteroidales bacterium]|nr:YigZ family protein [Bacteroidales bacterium]
MADTYKTVSKEVCEGFYSEKRSKFLAFVHHVDSVDEAMAIVKEYRKKYYDARHCCYAYVLGSDRADFRANDDGEPSSTAGKPILGQLNRLELTDVLAVVIRYYGGVNLGTGGLIVAYRTATEDALSKAVIEEKFVEERITYRFTYPMINAVMRVVKETGARIVSQSFDNDCEILLSIRQSLAEGLQTRLDKLSFE